MGVRELLTAEDGAWTPAEEKIIQVLLTDYPRAGLGTATSLARRAGVSDPTVGRFVAKLGFAGFTAFQERLLAEVEARLHSPLLMMGAKRPGPGDGAAATYLRSVARAVESTVSATPEQTYERAVRLVMEARGQVLLLGGRFSRHVAGMLGGYLIQFRSGIRDLGALGTESFDTLVDLGRRDVLVAFDYRRYQSDVVAYCRQAAARGVRIVLFTDPWLSPIADVAEVTIVGPTEVASPYDTLAPAVAQAEAFTAHLLALQGEEPRERIEALEDVRRANAATLDEPRESRSPRRPAPRRTAATLDDAVATVEDE